MDLLGPITKKSAANYDNFYKLLFQWIINSRTQCTHKKLYLMGTLHWASFSWTKISWHYRVSQENAWCCAPTASVSLNTYRRLLSKCRFDHCIKREKLKPKFKLRPGILINHIPVGQLGIRFRLLLLEFFFWSQLKRDYLLNLSISLRRGKESNYDSFSNGEWTGRSPTLKLEI